jgi:hypothetical protein
LTPPVQLEKVTRLELGFASTTKVESELLASNMAMLIRVTNVTIETRHWPPSVLSSEETGAAWRKHHRILLLSCIADFTEAEVEKGSVTGGA